MNDKAQAFEFLRTIQENLNDSLAGPTEMRGRIEELIALGRASAEHRHLCSPEHAFTRGILLPKIYAELMSTAGLNAEQARTALLAEGWSNYSEISSNTPARTVRHPFDKALTSDAGGIYRKWAKTTRRLPLTQSCPDFAFRQPSPCKVVFEAKYFGKDSTARAERELVEGLYQAFFYRALPPTYDNAARTWDYDYACLLAFDASEKGNFVAAWDSLDVDVRQGFWAGANVYVMMLRGRET